jgi:4-hydroxyphenylpyruvate dioxygenase-like putative hemolysin
MADLAALDVRVDGDAQGYLLHAFTSDVMGALSFEFLQRKNFSGFGEGDLDALAKAMETERMDKGILA